MKEKLGDNLKLEEALLKKLKNRPHTYEELQKAFPHPILSQALIDMEDQNVVENREGIWTITEKGKKEITEESATAKDLRKALLKKLENRPHTYEELQKAFPHPILSQALIDMEDQNVVENREGIWTMSEKGKKEITKESARLEYLEKDNVGTRHTIEDQANTYWNMRNMRQKFDPFVLYTFSTEDDARNALLELDCIHEAKDSGSLICTECLVFGYYQTKNGHYESIIAGEDLTHKLWKKAKENFEKHGLKCINDQEPEKKISKSKKVKGFAEKIEFIRTYTRDNNTYETYECDDAEVAKEFLLTKSVNEKLYYIAVATPVGSWGMDIKGLYKERLLPWQTRIESAEVEGHAIGVVDSFALGTAARGMADNFVVAVRCGNCGHEWIEGLRYQNWTLVHCPKCQKRNKINSRNYTAILV
jgi:hypothetical protein